jgi:hypothetical protein
VEIDFRETRSQKSFYHGMLAGAKSIYYHGGALFLAVRIADINRLGIPGINLRTIRHHPN